MKQQFLAVFIAVQLLAFPAASADYKKGEAAYGKGDYAAALKELRPLTEQGNSRAQGLLGLMYVQGQGVPLDYEKAAKWFRLSAEQGYALAQYSLGVAYANGDGVPQDDKEALKWIRLAAEQGAAIAQSDLAPCTAKEWAPRKTTRKH